MSDTQNFQNHARFFPPFHFVAAPILLFNFGWSIYRLIHRFSAESVVALLFAFAVLVLAFAARIMALTVQDRVIRLEMRLRMQQLLPAELRPRIPEFTVSQLVSLRFAGDAELPELSRRVLQDKITDRKAIKQLVRDWQADFLRA